MTAPQSTSTTPATASLAAVGATGRRARLRDCTLLVVDDERANVELLEALLESDGYRRVIGTTDPRTVPALMTQHAPDLVLLDLHMPHRHGHDVLADLVADTPAGDYRPVLVLTADATVEARDRALELGARDFLTKPFDAIEVLLRVENLLDTRLLHRDAQLARARAELAEVRAALLATWSRLLAATLDPIGTLAQLPRLLAQRDVVACVVGASTGGPISWYDASFEERGARAADALRLWAEALATPPVDGQVPIAAVAPSMGDLSLFSAPIATAAGVCGALVVAVRDTRAPSPIDQRLVEEVATRTGMALEHARLLAEAELATSERERLLAVVAHDLRNPLGAVAMYAEVLRSLQPDDAAETPVAAYAQKALATIHSSTRAMQHLVEDLLDASTLRGGALRIARAAVAVGAPLDEALAIMRPAAEASGVQLVADVQGDMTQAVALDAARASQLLCNLIANAVQVSPAGGRVTVRWAVSADGTALEGAVRDAGPGIPAEQLPHLFTAFWRGDRRDRQGVGLGLWIARAIVEGHGGELEVSTAPGAGSRFHFTLPFAPRARRRED